MTSGRISLACAVLLSAVYLSTGQSVTPIDDDIEDAVYLDSIRQVVTFVSALTNIGDNLTTIRIHFNRSVVSEIVSVSYDLIGEGRTYVSIDHKGVVTLKQRPRISPLLVGFSAFVDVRAVGRNGTVQVILNGLLELQSVGQSVIPIDDAVYLNSIRQVVTFVSALTNIGDNLTTIRIHFNRSVVSEIVSVSYNLIGVGRTYVSIDHKGVVTLKQRPRISPLLVVFGAFVDVRAVGRKGTVQVILNGILELRSVDADFSTVSPTLLRKITLSSRSAVVLVWSVPASVVDDIDGSVISVVMLTPSGPRAIQQTTVGKRVIAFAVYFPEKGARYQVTVRMMMNGLLSRSLTVEVDI